MKKRECVKSVSGKIQVSSKGFGFVTPYEASDRTQDIFIAAKNMGNAMNGDMVEVILSDTTNGRRPEGVVRQVLEHKITKVVGVFIKMGEHYFVEPDDKHLDIVCISKKDCHGAKHLDKVYVKITVYPDAIGHRKAQGCVMEVLGHVGDTGIDILSVIKAKELSLVFPGDVMAQANRIAESVKPGELKNRLDRRDRMIVTIDGEDAKDFDDAVFVRKVPGKRQWDLGVYIADVSYYVKENSVIDKEARERGNSIYLADRVLPMLPERLSNGICSLNEDVDRLVMACEMRFDEYGTLLDYSVAPGVIHSRHRLTYDTVRKILDGDKTLRDKYRDCVSMLDDANELRQILGLMRRKRGAINFEIPEIKVILNENLHPVQIVQRVQGNAENLIEEFMLAANECVANHLTNAKYPVVYRVHDEPKTTSIADLQNMLALFGLAFKHGEKIRPGDIQRVLREVAGRPEERLISAVTLRSMRQAVYQTDNIGHFGLASECYVHFTSPIRRYPDLLIHRLLRMTAEKKKLKPADFTALKEQLQEMAEYSSRRERLAVEAERETTGIKVCEYMLEHLGEEYDGIISGVTNFGIFVELSNGVEGMICLESLKDDFYELLEGRYCVVGIRTKKQYKLGDSLKVVVAAVNMDKHTIDLSLVETQKKEKYGKGNKKYRRK